ncbi:MAG: PAS domain S-box protein [Actinobacteria bacterium]|nr:PAS domain S-box protein [Actinomycetota bacterium]MBU1943795.1 PAS domain S-box protein [Actinomycetota bacterium]MBU2689044.1 PAS domain S-box protein [Actinomycetota bacterium]
MKGQEKPTILVIEDEAEVAQILESLLERKLSANVKTATSLSAARERLRSGAYDVITLDYKLPDGSGLELLQEIASSEDHPPVIMVTGHGNEEVASQALQMGAVGYVLKDDKMAVVLPETIEHTLRSFALIHAVEAVRESEEFYRTLFEESSDGLYIETGDGTIEDVNRAAAEMLGYAPSELRGKKAAELTPPDMIESYQAAVKNLLDGKTVTFVNLRKDGSTIPVEVTAREVFTRKGPRFIVAVRDMSARGGFEEELTLERDFTTKFLDAMNDAFFVLDLEGRPLRWNRTVTEVTGFTDEELLAATTDDFFQGVNLKSAMASLKKVLETGSDEIELMVTVKDGRELPYELSLALIRDSMGNPTAVSVIGRDISERKRADEALRNVIRETNERREEITALLESTRFVLEHPDFPAAAREVFDLCRKLIGARAGFLSLIARDDEAPRALIAEPEDARQLFESVAARPDVMSSERSFLAGRASYDNDFDAGPEAAESGFPIDNVLFVPLVDDSAVAGLIGFANKPGGFSGRDALMASAFGEIVSVALRNSRTKDMLAASEERFRTLVDNAPDIIYSISDDATLLTINPAVTEVLGWTPEEMVGRSFAELVHPDDFGVALETFEQALRGEVTRPYILRVKTRDGEYRTGEFISTPLIDKGEVVGELGVARDITRRREVDELVRVQTDLAMKLAGTADLPEMLEMILGGVLEVTGLDSGGIYVRDDDTGALDLLVHRGLSRRFVEDVSHIGPDSPSMDIVMRGEPIFERYDELNVPLDEIRREEGLQFIGIIPIKVEDEVIACLNVASHSLDLISGDLESIIEILAGQVGQAIARAKLSAAIRESEALYRALVETFPDGVVVIDRDGIITNASIEAIRMRGGYETEELVGRSVFELISPEERHVAMYSLETGLEEGSIRNLEYNVVRKDGSLMVGEVNATVIRGEDGKPVRAILTIRDVTQRKEAERALQALNNELEGYAHAVSHDLKGPLASIRAASETIGTLMKGEEESAALQGLREMARIIEDNVRRSTELIDELLMLAEAGQQPWDVEDVDVGGVVDRVLKERSAAIEGRKVRLDVDDDLGTVRASPTHMYQIFSNLIDNAVKHNDSTEPVITVSYLGRDDGRHRYRVRDNGSGIDPEMAEKVFLPFYAMKKGEHGVGLAIVAKIVGVYSGTVRVFNDEGAVFEFEIHEIP